MEIILILAGIFLLLTVPPRIPRSWVSFQATGCFKFVFSLVVVLFVIAALGIAN